MNLKQIPHKHENPANKQTIRKINLNPTTETNLKTQINELINKSNVISRVFDFSSIFQICFDLFLFSFSLSFRLTASLKSWLRPFKGRFKGPFKVPFKEPFKGRNTSKWKPPALILRITKRNHDERGSGAAGCGGATISETSLNSVCFVWFRFETNRIKLNRAQFI